MLAAHLADHPTLWIPVVKEGSSACWLPVLAAKTESDKSFGLDPQGEWVVAIQDQIQNLDFHWIASLPLLDWTREEFHAEMVRAAQALHLDLQLFGETLLHLVLRSGLQSSSRHWQQLALKWVTPYDYEHVVALEHLVEHGSSQQVRHLAKHKLKLF